MPPLTIHGELTLPMSVWTNGRMPDQVEQWLRTQGLLPAQVERCRWRQDAARLGYVLSYEVTLEPEEIPHARS